MAVPSTLPTVSPVIFMSTAADALEYSLPLDTIRWHMTTAATSTWTLTVTQSTAVFLGNTTAGTTVGWPLIGTTTQASFIGGSTAAAANLGVIDYKFENWVHGIVLVTISGGFIEVIKGAENKDWVKTKPSRA